MASELRAFVYDTVSARRAGTSIDRQCGTRGHRGFSLVPDVARWQLAAGRASTRREILRARRVTASTSSRSSGVHSGVNPISGDFSVGITGLMIRDGQLV
jgi:PmbA protein